MLISSASETKTALARFKDYNSPLQKVKEYKHGLWEIKSRNKEQTFALDLLTDPEIQIVSLIGKAGSGKTLMAIAAGLYQVLGNGTNTPEYNYLIVSRPVQPMGKDIGYLPSEIFYYDKMKVIDLLKYSASFYDKDCDERIYELAEIMELDLERKIQDLSYGNKKKDGIVQG